MTARYKEFSVLNLPSIEQEILAKWDADKAFEKSVSLREGATPFVFYEGPPSANGLPGIHHVISRTLKDLVCRYKTMKGFQVNRKGGWDTHGLPIELGVEKELGITKEDIGKKISIEEYNRKCREAVMRYKDKWDDVTRKMGYWVDLQHPYITFENNYIETLWWILSELYKKELLYESVSIQPYSPAAGTGLSSHELNQPGTYKMVKDTSAVAMFKAVKNEQSRFLFNIIEGKKVSEEIFFLAWTTTPWTLPSNLGLTVGANIDYVLISTFNPYTHIPINVVLAKALMGKYFKEQGENASFEDYVEGDKILPWKVMGQFKGQQMEECRYEQLLPFEANSGEKSGGDPFRVLVGDFVTTEDGTGIVHTAPAFGADDYRVGRKYGIGILVMVDKQGKFVDGLGEFSNRYVKNYKDEKNYVDVNVDICVKLKKENRAFKIEKYEHNYPHCWRTDKPVLYYPLDAWFIKTTAVKDRMVELNKTINWKPKSTGEGRFGNWLENMVDWNLSRSRFWGTPLPIWRTEDETEEKCIGSIDELKKELQKSIDAGCQPLKNGVDAATTITQMVSDLHKPFVDDIILVSDSGKSMKRLPDLIDVWFDSGAMPYAQWHYPFENKDVFKKSFPADFIAEGVDQTRGWFYTLHALGVMLFDSVAYKTCVSNGLVLDKNGNKMSKRLGNVVDPFKTIEQFGTDATRWYLITNASPWDNLKFDLDGIKEIQRKFFGTLYNTYQFFTLYANVDGFAFKEEYIPVIERPEIDQWILSSLNTLIKKVTENFDNYEPTAAGRLIEDFVDEHLSNWYVRLCRRRFWKGEYEQDKIAAYQTLYECLETVLRLMAPISPFFSDAVFRQLNEVTGRHKVSSVHHADFPVADEAIIDELLEERMRLAQTVSSLGLSIRKKERLKVRQPLQKIQVPLQSGDFRLMQVEFIKDIIRQEINVKEIEVIDINDFHFKKRIKPNYKTLGGKMGKAMKNVAREVESWNENPAVIGLLEQKGSYTFCIDTITNELVAASNGNNGSSIRLEETFLDDYDITVEDIPGWSVATRGSLTVALDISLTPVLKKEGEAREFVNRVQNIRKDKGFELTDRIFVNVLDNSEIKPSLIEFKNYICAEILADKLEFVPEISDGTEIDVNDIPLKVFVTKKV